MNDSPFGMAPQKKSPGLFGYPARTGAIGGNPSSSVGGSPNAPSLPTGGVTSGGFHPMPGTFARPQTPAFPGAPQPKGGPAPNSPFQPAPFTPRPNVPNESRTPYNYTAPSMTLLGMQDANPTALGGILNPNHIFPGGGGGGRPIGPGEGMRKMFI